MSAALFFEGFLYEGATAVASARYRPPWPEIFLIATGPISAIRSQRCESPVSAAQSD